MTTETAMIYARVSSEKQAADGKVSIKEQLADAHALCDREGWQIVGTFIDKEKYRKTRPPLVGKMVEPSGKYDDRPSFMQMLEIIETGQVDNVIYWDSYRFGRHERVLGTFTNSLDIGNAQRNDRGEIRVWEASKGVIITRMVLGIMTQVGREENEARARRIKMGHIGTLQQGRWPNRYARLGYATKKEEGKRGVEIVLAADEEVQTVRDIYNMADKGLSYIQIRKRLIAAGASQKSERDNRRKYQWADSVLGNILHSPDYMGQATYRFTDGSEYSIEIPYIIEPDQWHRVQAQIEKNKIFSERNAKDVYLLKGILHCGDCGRKVTVRKMRYRYKKLADGTVKRYKRPGAHHAYTCELAKRFDIEHTKPFTWWGGKLDRAVWKYLVDHAIENPDEVIDQIYARQADLQAQGDNLDSEINQKRQRLAQLDREELNYARQQARGKITENTFDVLMAEVEQARKDIQSDLDELIQLRDDAAKVEAGIDYTKTFLNQVAQKLPEIDQTPDELKALPKEHREKILRARQEIIRALCDKVIVYANGKIEILGAITGGKVEQLDPATLMRSLIHCRRLWTAISWCRTVLASGLILSRKQWRNIPPRGMSRRLIRGKNMSMR